MNKHAVPCHHVFWLNPVINACIMLYVSIKTSSGVNVVCIYLDVHIQLCGQNTIADLHVCKGNHTSLGGKLPPINKIFLVFMGAHHVFRHVSRNSTSILTMRDILPQRHTRFFSQRRLNWQYNTGPWELFPNRYILAALPERDRASFNRNKCHVLFQYEHFGRMNTYHIIHFI